MDIMKEDVELFGVKEGDAQDGVRWRQLRLAVATPKGRSQKGK